MRRAILGIVIGAVLLVVVHMYQTQDSTIARHLLRQNEAALEAVVTAMREDYVPGTTERRYTADDLARLTAIPAPRDEHVVLFHATHVYYDKDGRMLVQLLARRTDYDDGDYRSLYLYYIDAGYDGAGIPQAARMTGKDLPALGGGWYWWSRREHRG